MIKVVVFGASGLLGQTLRLYQPDTVEAIFCRKVGDPFHVGIDLTDRDAREDFLALHRPDVIINLAGQNQVDVVEGDPQAYREINAIVPQKLARYCTVAGGYYVHVSTQAVFSGKEPPYGPDSVIAAANAYGSQKAEAEYTVRQHGNWTIVRPTFMLGVRPLSIIGRRNPLEDLLLKPEWKEVNDRWFSPLFARDAAQILWEVALLPEQYMGHVVHAGMPIRISRYEIAQALALHRNVPLQPVPHEWFGAIAPRPIDTTYTPGSLHKCSFFSEGLRQCIDDWKQQGSCSMQERAIELSIFLGKSEASCLQRLQMGFQAAHAEVAADFRRSNPSTDNELLAWYAGTDSYLWELSVYHTDNGFNYRGMCQGLIERLKQQQRQRVLVLGDGIGDFTLWAAQHGLNPVYHDLQGSKTARFAQFRFWFHRGQFLGEDLTIGWEPAFKVPQYDAIVSLDFFEHLPNVEQWVQRCYEVLLPGGLLFAQNAFAIGSGPQGSIPMHLQCNDRFEKDWIETVKKVGFTIEEGNWYRK